MAGTGFRGKREIQAPRIILQKPAADQAALSRTVPPVLEEAGGGGAGGAGGGMEALAAEIRSCRLCRLCEKRTQAVPGAGVPGPLVMVIGEAPGEEEDLRGEPFVGPAGKYLDKWLQAIGLSRERNVYIANIVKCRPPGNRDPSPEEADACMPYLLRQLSVVRPKSILAVGRVAAQNLQKTSEGIGRLRGRVGTWQGLPFLATFHPSAVLRDPQLRRPVWEDMQTLRDLIGGTAGTAGTGTAPAG